MFDIERMKQALEGPRYTVPSGLTREERRQYILRVAAGEIQPQEEEEVDQYGNPLSGDRIIYCCFPDCGCDGARLCQAERGASSCAMSLNRERT